MNFFRVIYRFFIKNWYWIYPFAEKIWKLFKDNEMNRTGLFTPEQEKFLVNALKEFIKNKNSFYRWLITVGLKVFISGIDNFGLDKIGQTWKTDLIPIVDAAMEGRVHDVRGYVTDLLNKRIDIKFLDDYQELMLFDSLTKTIALAIDYYVQKKMV
jgi:hypothetical protein